MYRGGPPLGATQAPTKLEKPCRGQNARVAADILRVAADISRVAADKAVEGTDVRMKVDFAMFCRFLKGSS